MKRNKIPKLPILERGGGGQEITSQNVASSFQKPEKAPSVQVPIKNFIESASKNSTLRVSKVKIDPVASSGVTAPGLQCIREGERRGGG